MSADSLFVFISMRTGEFEVRSWKDRCLSSVCSSLLHRFSRRRSHALSGAVAIWQRSAYSISWLTISRCWRPNDDSGYSYSHLFISFIHLFSHTHTWWVAEQTLVSRVCRTELMEQGCFVHNGWVASLALTLTLTNVEKNGQERAKNRKESPMMTLHCNQFNGRAFIAPDNGQRNSSERLEIGCQIGRPTH